MGGARNVKEEHQHAARGMSCKRQCKVSGVNGRGGSRQHHDRLPGVWGRQVHQGKVSSEESWGVSYKGQGWVSGTLAVNWMNSCVMQTNMLARLGQDLPSSCHK